MKNAVCGIVFLAGIASAAEAGAEDVVPIFQGSFHVSLPDGVATSENQPAPIDEILQQLSMVDGQGRETFGVADAALMRMALFRGVFAETVEDVPQLSQRFTIVADPEDMAADQMAAARMDSSFWFSFENSNKIVRPLQLVRMGETWWQFDDDLDVSVTVDIFVPSFEICRFLSEEAICIHRFLDDEVDWRDTLTLSMGETRLSKESYLALSQTAYFQLPLAILQSVTPTDDYRPCCKALR